MANHGSYFICETPADAGRPTDDGFYGTYKSFHWSDKPHDVYGYTTSGTFVRINNETSIETFCAYLYLPSAGGKGLLTVNLIDPISQGIAKVTSEKVLSTPFYDVTGRAVYETKTQSIVYLKDDEFVATK